MQSLLCGCISDNLWTGLTIVVIFKQNQPFKLPQWKLYSNTDSHIRR